MQFPDALGEHCVITVDIADAAHRHNLLYVILEELNFDALALLHEVTLKQHTFILAQREMFDSVPCVALVKPTP